MVLATVYIRYCHVKCAMRESEDESVRPWCNIISAALGFLTAIGLSMLGNFHKTSVSAVHLVGVFLCFVFGGFYLMLQTHFSRKLKPVLTTKVLYLIRVQMLWITCVLMASLSIGALLAMRDYKGKKGEDTLTWRKEDGGWEMHLISTFSQWIVVLVSNVFIATFTCDLRRSDFKIHQTSSITSSRPSA